MSSRVKMVRTQTYETTDGKVFVQCQEAVYHQRHIDLEEWADGVSLCRGGEWSRDMVLEALLEDANRVADILKPGWPVGPETG